MATKSTIYTNSPYSKLTMTWTFVLEQLLCVRVATSSRRKSITLNFTPALKTKFLVAAEVFVLIPLITAHLQGNSSGITAHAGIRREYAEMKQAMFCFSCGSQTFQSTTRFISAFTIGFSDRYLYFLPLAIAIWVHWKVLTLNTL